MEDLESKILDLVAKGELNAEEAKELLMRARTGQDEHYRKPSADTGPQSQQSPLSQQLVHLPGKSHALRNWLIGTLMTLGLATVLGYYTLYVPHKKKEAERKVRIAELLNPNVDKEMVIIVKDEGEIIVDLYEKDIPEIIEELMELVSQKKYDNTFLESKRNINTTWIRSQYPIKSKIIKSFYPHFSFGIGDVVLSSKNNKVKFDKIDFFFGNRNATGIPLIGRITKGMNLIGDESKIKSVARIIIRDKVLTSYAKNEQQQEKQSKKEQYQQQERQEEPREDYKYSATNYYNVGEWANAGDLEFIIHNSHLKQEKFVSRRVGGDYIGWKLYISTTIKNITDGYFNLPYSEIQFSDGNIEDECEEGEEGVRGSASIPPGASIDRTFSKWVNGWDNLYVRLVIRKLKRTADGGFEHGEGKTYINIVELGELPVEN